MQQEDISNYTFDEINFETDPYNKCYLISTKFKVDKVEENERSRFLNLFIESMNAEYQKNGNNSSISYLISYIFKFLKDDEKNKLIPEFIKNSEPYNPKAYKDILPYCTDEQRNRIILEKDCIKNALYTAYINSCTQENYQKIEEKNYQTFKQVVALDPVFQDVINEIAPETLENAFTEINQVFQGKVDYTKSQAVEKSGNWQITVSTMEDHILKTPKQSQDNQKSFVDLINQRQSSRESLSKG